MNLTLVVTTATFLQSWMTFCSARSTVHVNQVGEKFLIVPATIFSPVDDCHDAIQDRVLLLQCVRFSHLWAVTRHGRLRMCDTVKESFSLKISPMLSTTKHRQQSPNSDSCYLCQQANIHRRSVLQRRICDTHVPSVEKPSVDKGSGFFDVSRSEHTTS